MMFGEFFCIVVFWCVIVDESRVMYVGLPKLITKV